MQNRPLLAAGYILMGTVTVSFIDQFIRVIAEQSSLWTFHTIRSVMILGGVLIWLKLSGRRLAVGNLGAVAARSAVLATGLMIYFGSLGFMPVAQAAAGLFTAPIWVLIFSVVLFRLPVGPVRTFAVLVGFVGVVLVLSPDPATVSPWVFAPVLGGAFYAMGAIATREWCPGEAALVLSMGTFAAQGLWGLGGVAVLSVTGPLGDGFLSQGWVVPDTEMLLWCVMQAFGSLMAVICLTKGYQTAEASLVSVFEYSVLAFSALFGWLVWSDALTPLSMIGLMLIAAAGSLIALRGQGASS